MTSAKRTSISLLKLTCTRVGRVSLARTGVCRCASGVYSLELLAAWVFIYVPFVPFCGLFGNLWQLQACSRIVKAYLP